MHTGEMKHLTSFGSAVYIIPETVAHNAHNRYSHSAAMSDGIEVKMPFRKRRVSLASPSRRYIQLRSRSRFSSRRDATTDFSMLRPLVRISIGDDSRGRSSRLQVHKVAAASIELTISNVTINTAT